MLVIHFSTHFITKGAILLPQDLFLFEKQSRLDDFLRSHWIHSRVDRPTTWFLLTRKISSHKWVFSNLKRHETAIHNFRISFPSFILDDLADAVITLRWSERMNPWGSHNQSRREEAKKIQTFFSFKTKVEGRQVNKKRTIIYALASPKHIHFLLWVFGKRRIYCRWSQVSVSWRRWA